MSKKVNLEQYTREVEFSVDPENGWSAENVQTSAFLRIATAVEETNSLLGNSRFCRLRRAVEKIADEGITVTYKLRIEIKWPWKKRRRKRRKKKTLTDRLAAYLPEGMPMIPLLKIRKKS